MLYFERRWGCPAVYAPSEVGYARCVRGSRCLLTCVERERVLRALLDALFAEVVDVGVFVELVQLVVGDVAVPDACAGCRDDATEGHGPLDRYIDTWHPATGCLSESLTLTPHFSPRMHF